MSDLRGNKILGAALGTAFTIALIAVVVPMVFEKEPPKTAGYAIAAVDDSAGGEAAVADTPPDWGTVLPTADVKAGEAKTAVCQTCHKFDPAGTNSTGPGLFGVVGREPGSHPGFAYSSGMADFSGKNPVWTYDLLYDFLKNPGAKINGTKMTYAGMKDPQDRINVIAYLHTLGSNLPVPPPKPKAAAAPAAGAAPAAPAADAKK